MMSLQQWLSIATRRLSTGAVLQVEAEITSHYDSALEAALADGLSDAEAAARALESLGDPKSANREYRRVLLTNLEVTWLANFTRSEREQHSVLNRRVRKGVAVTLIAITALQLATTRRLDAFPYILATVLAIELLPSVLASFPAQRIRRIRWSFMAVVVAGLWWFGLRERWGILVLVAAFAWIDWIKASIRRKLPREQWPSTLAV